jgi:hypothetical protein
MYKKLLLLILLSSFSHSLLAQKGIQTFDPKLKTFEDSLKSLSYKIINHDDEVVRRNSNNIFIKTLVATLKLDGSFYYPFDSIKSISILTSADKVFRIFTWHLYSDDGTYRYYGAIQKNNKEKLELYPLFDNSRFIPNAEDTILNKDSWYGAHYYSISEPQKSKRNKQYLLLGWKGNDTKTNKKVIDVLSFDKEGKPVFGAPIFMYNDTAKTRVIFTYGRNVSMLLRYLPSKKWIVYDHLATADPRQKGMYEFYGPDLSYDGLKYKRRKWYLMENIDLRNEKSELDKLFIDPREESE